MTVTIYSITPPTTHTTRYLLRPTVLVAPSLRKDEVIDLAAQMDRDSLAAGYRDTAAEDHALAEHDMGAGADTLDDIDSMYDQTLEDPVGLLEKSAEITRFP